MIKTTASPSRKHFLSRAISSHELRYKIKIDSDELRPHKTLSLCFNPFNFIRQCFSGL